MNTLTRFLTDSHRVGLRPDAERAVSAAALADIGRNREAVPHAPITIRRAGPGEDAALIRLTHGLADLGCERVHAVVRHTPAPRGRVADLVGRKRMLLAGLGLFTLASLSCGLATSGAELTVARVVQGMGAAAMSEPAHANSTPCARGDSSE
jgi:hypothetical protein